MMADIAQGEAAEKGVAECVNRNVSVGMRHETGFGHNPDSAEPHRETLGNLMHVIAVSNAEGTNM